MTHSPGLLRGTLVRSSVVTVCLGWARRGRLILLQGGCPLIFAPTSANQHHQDINSVAPAVGLPPRK
ncbi:hypothetical protein Pmani_027120 [Petrolisthes manimaculis]|uniref:Uncharacterized protein n=1 Tax=Petrolisthes manimaculis TaxID=1843537 RepID=A0AAE1P4A4_9EUCA|nr:hypothetical protein Pmani_027120 [Petrolisthes manimaculis]